MSTPYPPYPPPQPAPAGCYRHPDRATYLGCTRCGRPICPECMHAAAVGQQCPDCVRAGAASVPPVRTAAGGVQRSGTPIVSYALIAVNVLVFVLQTSSPNAGRSLALVPDSVAGGEYYRLLTSGFIHYGLLHILFNMYALYILGPPLERHLGRIRFTALYFLSLLGGSVVVYLFSAPTAATGGASGAIFGLFGATFVASRKLNLDVGWLVGLIAVNLIITFAVPNISWQGHVGGLVTGALVAAAFVYAPRANRNAVQLTACVGLLAVFGALVLVRTAALVG